MNARYWQRGETLDYTAEEAVVNGQVVSLGNRIGSDATVLVNIGDPDGAPAIHNSLALKCTDGKVYDITVATGGTLTATERT